MIWKTTAASVAGSSHLANSLPCQDNSFAAVMENFDHSPLLLIVVSDGAGSASKGAIGSDLSIQTTIKYIEAKTQSSLLSLELTLATDLVRAIRKSIEDKAIEDRMPTRDYACTFLGLMSSLNESLLMQIGDGGIVIDVGNGLDLPIFPMSGEYANMTNFITDSSALDALQTVSYSGKIQRAALFTDGLERLALNMAKKTVFLPFFDPLFIALKDNRLESEEAIKNALINFLDSEKLNDRTDDDKTLALGIFVGF